MDFGCVGAVAVSEDIEMFKLFISSTLKAHLVGIQVFTYGTVSFTRSFCEIEVLIYSEAERSRSYTNATFVCVAPTLKLIDDI